MRAGLMCVVYKKALLVGGKAGGSRQWQEAADNGSGREGGRGSGRPSGGCDDDDDDGDRSVESMSPYEGGKVSSASSSGNVAEVATLMSVDAGRVVNMLGAFHELWSLPMQMAVALYLLYLQVRN